MSPENLEYPEESGKKPEQEKPKAKVVCAWCKKEMGEVEWPREGEVTHGICPNCREKFFHKPDKERK